MTKKDVMENASAKMIVSCYTSILNTILSSLPPIKSLSRMSTVTRDHMNALDGLPVSSEDDIGVIVSKIKTLSTDLMFFVIADMAITTPGYRGVRYPNVPAMTYLKDHSTDEMLKLLGECTDKKFMAKVNKAMKKWESISAKEVSKDSDERNLHIDTSILSMEDLPVEEAIGVAINVLEYTKNAMVSDHDAVAESISDNSSPLSKLMESFEGALDMISKLSRTRPSVSVAEDTELSVGKSAKDIPANRVN